MTQTVSKTQWPDYSEYGLYLLPRNYQYQYGFSEDDTPGRCLLLLDVKESITEETAVTANLRRLLHDADKKTSLYLVLPKKKRRNIYQYPAQSEILQDLGLAYVARTQVITPAEATKQFRDALGDLRYQTSNLLDFSVAIGTNPDGDTVFFSPYGRYIERYHLDAEGKPTLERIRASKLPLASCLYVLDAKGEVDNDALNQCVNAYLSTATHHAFNQQTAKQFAQMLFQIRPENITVGQSVDITQSIIDSVINEALPLDMTHWQLFNNMVLVNENIQLHQKIVDHSNYQEFFHEALNQTNNRHRLNASGKQHSLYKASVPAPLAPIIASLLVPCYDQSTKSVYSPSIGNGALLAGFKHPLDFNVNEPDSINFKLLKRFVEWVNASNTDRDNKASYFMTNKEIGLITPTKKYDLSLALLPSGVSPISTLIPFLDNHGGRHLSLYTDMLDQTLLIETLNERNPDGRSVFLGPIEDNGQVGKVGRHYVHLLQWLQAYFHDVSVVDLSAGLFDQSLLPSPSRLYVVGAAKEKPRNPNVLNERISHLTKTFNIPVFSTYSQLVEFEQAVKLIDTSKRRPEIDLASMHLDNGDLSEGMIDEEQSLISLFYTLRPKPKEGAAAVSKPKTNVPFVIKPPSATPATLYISDSGEPISEEDAVAERSAVNEGVSSPSMPSTTDDTPSDTETPKNEDEGTVTPTAPVHTYYEYEDYEDNANSDDMGGMAGMFEEGQPKENINMDFLTGNFEADAEPDMDAFGDHNQVEQSEYTEQEEPNFGDDDDTKYRTIDEPVTPKQASVESNIHYQTFPDQYDDLSEGPTENYHQLEEPIDPNHPQQEEPDSHWNDDDEDDDDDCEDENEDEDDDSWFDIDNLQPIYYGPRYIDEPQRYLIQRDSSNSNQRRTAPPVFHPDTQSDDEGEIFTHAISQLKNEAVRQHLDRAHPPTAQQYLKSLSLVETHAPALLILKPSDFDTLEVLPLHDFADGNALQAYLDTNRADYHIHSVFSLLSHQHNSEVREALTQIKQINEWLKLPKSQHISINTLYEADNQAFFDLYSLAARYDATIQPSIGRTIKHEINSLKPHGIARLYEYKARFWARNPESIAEFDIDKPFCLAFEPATYDNDELKSIGDYIVSISNQNVYAKDFSQDFHKIAQYLVPGENLAMIAELAARLATPKELSFLVFMRLTVQMHALFLAGAHRFFLHNCRSDGYKDWLSKLYSHKDASTNTLEEPAYRARQALDVDYARHLLQQPVMPFDDEAIRAFRVRYSSQSSYAQATSNVQIQAQEDLQHALMRMQSLWRQSTLDFSINTWFSEQALVDAHTINVDMVDMVFMAVTNTLLKRPTYLYNQATPDQLSQFLRIVAKILDGLKLTMVCTSNAKMSEQAIQASTDAGVPFVPSNAIANKKGVSCVVAVHDTFDVNNLLNDRYGSAITINYVRHAPATYAGAVKRLCQSGQLLPLHKPDMSMRLVQLPHTANQHVMTEVYEQYSRAFDAMRQLGMLAYKLAGTLKEVLLGDLLLSCSNSAAFSWWFENQAVFLYGAPDTALTNKRKDYIKNLSTKQPLSDGDKAALHSIQAGTELFLPNIETCNTDAWLVTIYNHLLASLQSPQIVTECLDFINNGLQPILLIEDDYDDLLHHVLVSEQGRSLPFSQMFELKNEKQMLRHALAKNPTDTALHARLAHVDKLLAEVEKQRQDEVLALFHQNKTFARPLIADALRCFLYEVDQFYIQDTNGGKQSLMTSDARAAIEQASDYNSFRQLLNTLMQMIDDDIFAKLPLPALDVIAQQLKRHGHSLKHPSSRSYVLQNTDKNDGLWFLEKQETGEPEQVDMRIITSSQADDISALRHPARQTRLVLARPPNSTNKFIKTKAVIERLAPLLSNVNDMTVWIATPLCEADVIRHEMLNDYLKAPIKPLSNAFLSESARSTALQYLHTVMYLIPTARIHIEGDMPYLLSLIAQKPGTAQQQHLVALNDKLCAQTNLNISIEKYGKTHLPQSVFTRRTPAQSDKKLSVTAIIKDKSTNDASAGATASLFLGANDSVHDIYYKDHYKPIELESVLNLAAKYTIDFKDDLNELIDNHPDKDRIYTSLSDHESNPEADYFIELDDDKKKAYIYKHLIRDMAYRGIKHRIVSDLYDNQGNMPALFNSNRALISHELINTQDNQNKVRVLCEFIQELTGVSKYIEQLQAQMLAKAIIDYQVEAVCQLSSDEITPLKLPVITCRPKAHLTSSLLSKNTPAINGMFSRYFSEVPPNDSVFLGKNEWLITCGFKLPHYERVFDLNNLLCYVANIGCDSTKASTTFLTNTRHLYTDYVEKKALLVESSHDVYQGDLTLVFETLNSGFKLQKHHGECEVMSKSLPISWRQLEIDMQLFGETKGIGYEQVLVGENEYYEYCKNAPEFFEPVVFNDVSGKYHTAIKMTDQGKSRFLNFRAFFDVITPLKTPIVIDYLTRSLSRKTNSLTISCHSNYLNGVLRLEAATIDNKSAVLVHIKSPSSAELMAGKLSQLYGTPIEPKLFRYTIFDTDISALIKVLGLNGFYVTTTADDVLFSTFDDYATSLLSITTTINPQPATLLVKKKPKGLISGLISGLLKSPMPSV